MENVNQVFGRLLIVLDTVFLALISVNWIVLYSNGANLIQTAGNAVTEIMIGVVPVSMTGTNRHPLIIPFEDDVRILSTTFLLFRYNVNSIRRANLDSSYYIVKHTESRHLSVKNVSETPFEKKGRKLILKYITQIV